MALIVRDNRLHLKGFTIFVDSPVGIYNICECLNQFGCRCSTQCTVETCNWDFYVLIGNSNTSLLLFLKGHVDKPVNSGGMLKVV